MAKQNEALFEESSQGAVSAVTAVTVVLSAVLMIGGLVAAGYSFDATMDAGTATWLFVGGLLATVVGFALPFNLLPASGK